jgi:hypothetical protein
MNKMGKETLKEIAEKLKNKELFKESNDRARQTLSEIKSLPIQERSYSDKKLYSEIEWLIISWNNDGTKTAGHLTRQIIEQLKNK